MNAIFQYEKFRGRCSQFTDAVEEAKRVLHEECERRLAVEAEQRTLRRARIQNGKHPAYKNGHPKSAEKKGGCV